MERIKLNLIPKGPMPVCHASQYDTGRKIGLDIYNGLQPYILTDEQIELDVRKSDGRIVTLDVPITAKSNTVVFSTTEQMCAVAGSNLCELKITKNEAVTHSLNFAMEIERSPMENGLQSESEINNLTTQIEGIIGPILEEEIPEAVEQAIGDNYPTREEFNLALQEKADTTDIPTKTSQLTNDSGFAEIDDASTANNKVWSAQKSASIDYNKANGNIGAGQNTLKNTTGANNTAIGVSALQGVTTGGYNVGAGRNAGDAITTGSNNVVIGYNADVAAGTNASVVAVGRTATAGDHSAAVGNNVNAAGGYSVAIGDSAQATTNNSLAIGRKAHANFVGSIAIGTDDQGNGAETTEKNEMVFGTARHIYTFLGKLRNLVVSSKNPNPTAGDELAPAISTFSGSGAIWNGSYWQLAEGNSISTTLTLEADSDYLIIPTVSNAVTPNAEVKPLTISLESDSISIFGANDATWQVVLHTTNGGAVSLTLGGATWSGRISNISVKKVTSYINPALKVEGRNVHAYGTNIVFGNGHNKMALPLLGNTAVGYESQVALNSGKGNTAVGIKTQKSLTNGSHNTAVGENVQEELTTGMYNTAMGFHTQEHLISGCWNVSVGNENLKDTTTGCNNTTMGRRALNSLIDGHKNTVMGAQAGFVRDGVWDAIASIHSNEQAFFGFQATQYGAGQQDKASAFGSHACSNENGLALGAYTQARGNGSVAIGTDSNGNGAIATSENDFVLGTSSHRFIFGNKVINFNLDGTVTWEPLT